MSRSVSIRFTDEVLALIDSCTEKLQGNRSSFVRDACLAHASSLEEEDVSFVKINPQNSLKLRQLASEFNTDHDKFLNNMLEILFDQMEKNPFPGTE